MRTRALAAATVAALALPAATAEAGPAGRWTELTPAASELLNFQGVSLLRTDDGVLHVGWARQEQANAASALHSTIPADAATISKDAYAGASSAFRVS